MANKFVVRGTTPDGAQYEEKTNSYYLAVLLKEKLNKKGYSVKVCEPDVVWNHRGNVHYNGSERGEFKKLKEAYNDKMTKCRRRKIRANYKNSIGEMK